MQGPETSFVWSGAEIEEDVSLGQGTVVEPSARISVGVEIGRYCVINARVGVLTKIQSYVELRKGTVIGEDCYIDSGVKMSGDCFIGNNVTVRYDAIIARGCEIGDGSYISPQVMFMNVSVKGEEVGGAKVGENVFIGTNATIGHGVTICNDAVIGAKALVVKDITEPGTYVGVPARRIK